MSNKSDEKSQIIDLYGNDHSPWVQSVLLYLYDNNINYNLRTIPTLSLLLKSGVMMPAIRLNSYKWKLDSTEILQTFGNDSVSSSEKQLIFKTWQGVQHRVDNPFMFFYAFSLCKGFQNNALFNLYNHALRPLTSIYFFTLLSIIKIKIRKFTINEKFLDQYAYWNNKLLTQGTNFFGGNSLNIIDYQLFGIIQCHCSIPYFPLVKTLQEDQELDCLRKWISNMHVKFANYPHLYSANYFNPKQKIIQKASFLEKITYWSGFVTLLLMLPFTIVLILILLMRRK